MKFHLKIEVDGLTRFERDDLSEVEIEEDSDGRLKLLAAFPPAEFEEFE